jgi:hypothetical protein
MFNPLSMLVFSILMVIPSHVLLVEIKKKLERVFRSFSSSNSSKTSENIFRSSYLRQKKTSENAFRSLKLGAKKEIRGERVMEGGKRKFPLMPSLLCLVIRAWSILFEKILQKIIIILLFGNKSA